MAKLSLILVTFVLFGAAAASLRRVCYYTNWAQYRNGPGKFYPENVDPNLCTHIIYAFAKMIGNHLAAFEWNDESTPWMKGMYERFGAIKKQNPSVKLMLAVGGWNMGSAPFTRMVASAAGRQEFAKTTVAFLRKNGFDGLDLDWEYPANRGSPAGDRPKFTQLVQTLRDEFSKEAVPAGKETLLLSAAVGAGKDKIDTAYEVPQLSRLLDFINLMSYDLHGSWEDFTGHHSPLYSRSNEVGNQTFLNVDWAAKYWVQKGAAREKMNIGVPLYGRSFKLPYGQSDTTIGCHAAGAGAAGMYTREAGFKSYYEVCKKLQAGAKKYYEPEQKVPYMVDGDLWVGYDDPDSVKLKVDYIKQEHFGGVMVWALDLDDFSGMCGQGKYPLLNAIVAEANAATGPVNQGQTTTTTGSPAVVTTQAPAHTTKPPMVTTKAPIVITNPPTTQAPITTKGTTTKAEPVTTAAPATTAVPKPATDMPAPTTTQAHSSGGLHHDLTIVSNTEFDCASKSDGFYASPTSCSHFYICAASSAFRTDCHPGLVFNPATRYCDFPDHVTCNAGSTNTQPQPQVPSNTQAPIVATNPPVTQAPWTPAPTTQMPTTTTTAAFVPGKPAEFCKSKADGFYKDPTDCSRFYQCSFHVSYHETCPSGTYFSDALQGCDWAANVPSCP